MAPQAQLQLGPSAPVHPLSPSPFAAMAGALESAVMVAGMQRSGVSVVSSMLVELGIVPGQPQLAPGPTNLNGRLDDMGSMLLHVWDGLFGGPLYLLVYRFPWEVADSMQRLGTDLFLRHPDYAYRDWMLYNRRLLDFHRRHAGRSLLLSVDALVHQPERLVGLLRDRLRVHLRPLSSSVVRPDLFHRRDKTDPLIRLVARAHPDCLALLAELDASADVSGADLWSSRPSAHRTEPRQPARLSIIIPCFDQGEFLLEAVASVERSVCEPYELIIVNDGSSERRTLDVLEMLRRAGYQIIDQPNSGLAAARNRGFEEASTSYILPLDADNRLRPEFVSSALAILDARPEVGVVYGDRRDFGLRSESVDVPPFDPDQILPFNFIDACALLRKEVWSTAGGYDPALPAWEDWDLWIGAAERGWQFEHVPCEAFDYRVRPDSMVSLTADETLRWRLYTYILSKHRDIYSRRLPELLIAAGRSAADLSRLAQTHEQAEIEAHASIRAQAAKVHAADEELANLDAGINALNAERESLRAELTGWRERVAFMEGRRVWRVRGLIVSLKRTLAQRPLRMRALGVRRRFE